MNGVSYWLALLMLWSSVATAARDGNCGLSITSKRSYLPPPADVDLPYYTASFHSGRGGVIEIVAVRHEFSAQGEKSVVSTSGDGVTWRPLHSTSVPSPLSNGPFAALGKAVKWDPEDSGFGLKSEGNELTVTKDHGKSWAPTGQESILEEPVTLRGQQRALAALQARGLKSHYSVGSWQRLVIFDIAFGGVHRGTVYLISNKGIFKSSDYAQSWRLLSVGITRLFSVSSLAINQRDPAELLVGTTDGLYMSRDGGCTFKQVLKSE